MEIVHDTKPEQSVNRETFVEAFILYHSVARILCDFVQMV